MEEWAANSNIIFKSPLIELAKTDKRIKGQWTWPCSVGINIIHTQEIGKKWQYAAVAYILNILLFPEVEY